MRRAIRRAALLLAATGALVALATGAWAFPSITSPCDGCHGGPDIPITTQLLTADASNATYSFNAAGADSFSVFNGTTLVQTINASSGQFTVTVGNTYTLYSVAGPSTNDGLGTSSVSPVAPPEDDTPPVTTSDAVAEYFGTATITLTPTDEPGGSGVAATYYVLDGGSQTPGTTVVVSALGPHTLDFWSVDVAGNTEATNTVEFTVSEPVAGMTVVAGADRFETAVQVSQRMYPTGLSAFGTRTVVIATGLNWPDALGGSALAGVLDGPVLLVSTDSAPPLVLAEILRLGATRAIILGGTPAVGTAVESDLKALLGASNVERIAGTDRYKTADAIAARVIELKGLDYDGTAFIATGGTFPDALAAAPLAAANGWPLLLANPVTGLSADTIAGMADVTRGVILGSASAVPVAVETQLNGLLGAPNVVRLGGTDRYDTAVLVASWGVANAELGWDGLAIATGENFPDALAGGVMQGKDGSVLLLTRSSTLSQPTRVALEVNAETIERVVVLGGPSAVSVAVRDAVTAAIQ